MTACYQQVGHDSHTHSRGMKTLTLIAGILGTIHASVMLVQPEAAAHMLQEYRDKGWEVTNATACAPVLQAKHPCSLLWTGRNATGVSISRFDLNRTLSAMGKLQVPVELHDRFLGQLHHTLRYSTIETTNEAAMFLAHLWHTSDAFKYVRNQTCQNPSNVTMTACLHAYSGNYYGRGYMQVATRANYAAASKEIYPKDTNRLLDYPELVAEDDCVNWRVALSFWERTVHNVTRNGEFGKGVALLNATECTDGSQASKNLAKDRLNLYKAALSALNITVQPNITGCSNLG